ncbi:MAG: hypothetical protein E3J83_06190 [Candidatus Atribacteria bacterium]|nr:MAG: hypothetical protein E3J83_06190 [Candidatus Atribacteria bacterium]
MIERHNNLYKELIQIPEKRKMIYREEIDNNKLIVKPRFKEKEYNWPKQLLIDLRDHLQELWNYYELYSYWLDSSLMLLLDYRTRKTSKKSVLFLLEMDVWQTDEVYGDYLIEKESDKTNISYTRFGQKYKEKSLNTMDDRKIEDWICNDAVIQIQMQFKHLWEKLKKELEVCTEEKFRKQPKITLSLDYLEDQVEKIKNVLDLWPESALLNLGRILEIWLLIELKIKTNYGLSFLIKEAEIRNLIDKHQFKLLINIKNHYNDLKHQINYRVNKKVVKTLIDDFSSAFS